MQKLIIGENTYENEKIGDKEKRFHQVAAKIHSILAIKKS
jgi:hypothetical protein